MHAITVDGAEPIYDSLTAESLFTPDLGATTQIPVVIPDPPPSVVETTIRTPAHDHPDTERPFLLDVLQRLGKLEAMLQQVLERME